MTWTLWLMLLQVPTESEISQNRDFWLQQLDGNSIDLKINALQKLAEIRDLKSIPRLLSSMEDPSSEVRYHTIRALANHPSEEMVKSLSTALLSEKDPYLKAEIKRSIKQIEDLLAKRQSTKP